MSSRESKAVLEIVFVVAVAMLASIIFLDSLNLPVSLREPLGSSSIPQIVCGLVVLFCLVLFVRSCRVLIQEQKARRLFSGTSKTDQKTNVRSAQGNLNASGNDPAAAPRQITAVIVYLLAITYVAIIESRQISVLILTPAFLFASIIVIKKFQRNAAIPAFAIAIVIGLGVPFVFTEFFNVNLP